MTGKISEWVAFGPLELEVRGWYDPHLGVWEGGPFAVRTFDELCEIVAKELLEKNYTDLSASERSEIEAIADGIDRLAPYHKFSSDAWSAARARWAERDAE